MLQPIDQTQCGQKEKEPQNTCLLKGQWKAHHSISKIFSTKSNLNLISFWV